MRDLHDFETHENRTRDFTGSHEKISTTGSSERKAMLRCRESVLGFDYVKTAHVICFHLSLISLKVGVGISHLGRNELGCLRLLIMKIDQLKGLFSPPEALVSVGVSFPSR